MRRPVSLAYLLARISDTLADTSSAPIAQRVALLDGFVTELETSEPAWRSDLADFQAFQEHPGEIRLIQRLADCMAAFRQLPAVEKRHVGEVLQVITAGQKHDLTRFQVGGEGISSDHALEEYCYQVAGCVGVFWTRIGFLSLGTSFSNADQGELESAALNYGKGLQLVNILRDLPSDLAAGRCYLPQVDRARPQSLLDSANLWRGQAREWLEGGVSYARRLNGKRLRIASSLPAFLGLRTLDLLDKADWEELQRGVKVTRPTVRRELLRAALL